MCDCAFILQFSISLPSNRIVECDLWMFIKKKEKKANWIEIATNEHVLNEWFNNMFILGPLCSPRSLFLLSFPLFLFLSLLPRHLLWYTFCASWMYFSLRSHTCFTLFGASVCFVSFFFARSLLLISKIFSMFNISNLTRVLLLRFTSITIFPYLVVIPSLFNRFSTVRDSLLYSCGHLVATIHIYFLSCLIFFADGKLKMFTASSPVT